MLNSFSFTIFLGCVSSQITAELISNLNKSWSDCAAMGIKLLDFELKRKLLSNLPPGLIGVAFQQRDKSHANDTFNVLAEAIRSCEKTL